MQKNTINSFSVVLLLTLLLTVLVDSVSLTQAQDTGAVDSGISVPLNVEVTGNVEFWHFWGSPVRRNAIRRVIALCQQALPNITVEEVFKPFGDIWTANVAAVAAGSGMPDIIVEDRPQLARLARDGVQQNLQQYVDRDTFDSARFWPAIWSQTQYEGGTYGIPFETDVRVLFYNKTLFQQAGLDPNDPPETWDELQQYADALDAYDANGNLTRMGFFPILAVGPDIWAQTNGHTWVSDDAVPNLNSPEAVETLEWVQSWIERYGGWDAVQSFRANFAAPPNDAFMSSKVAMFADIGGYLSILNFYRPQVALDDGSTVNMEWGVAPIPNQTGPSSSSGGFALSIPTGAENPEAAWELIKCMTSPEGQVSWARDTYAMPSDMNAARDPILMADPNWAMMVEAMETSETWPFVAGYPNWKEQLDQRLEQVWQGTITAEQALQEAQQAIDDVLQQSP
jgi:multiple sugar transport system substrate-binding protein